MANQFLTKYSANPGVVPTASELPLRQIAINTADGRLFIKKTDGTILTFESAEKFALAVHSHAISDVTGLQSALDTLTSAAAAAQSGADASLKKSSNLSDLVSVSAARTNLSVDSSSEVSAKVATAKSEAQAYADAAIAALINGSPAALDTLKEIADALKNGEDVATALASSIAAVSSRVTTLEGQNLDSRLSTAESDIDTLQSDVVTAQNAANAAQSTADSAVTAAAAAQSTADTAVTNAATAQSAAEAAQLAADNAQTSANNANAAAATAQAGADASLKKSSNLSDLTNVASARTALSVDSSAEVDSKVSSAVSSAQTTLQSNIDGVSSRVSTLEGQNLDSRLSSAEGTIAGLGTMSTQNSDSVSITGGSLTGSVTFGASGATLPTDSGKILTENSVIDCGEFFGSFNGGGGDGGSNLPYGTFIRTESTYVNCAGSIYTSGTQNVYADGNGGEYSSSPVFLAAGELIVENAITFDAANNGTQVQVGTERYLHDGNGGFTVTTEYLPYGTYLTQWYDTQYFSNGEGGVYSV